MPDHSLETRRKRLLFRSWHRGFREIDLVLGAFAARHLQAMGEAELGLYEALLELPDHQLYAWIVGQEAVPLDYDSTVMTRLRGLDYFDRG